MKSKFSRFVAHTVEISFLNYRLLWMNESINENYQLNGNKYQCDTQISLMNNYKIVYKSLWKRMNKMEQQNPTNYK